MDFHEINTEPVDASYSISSAAILTSLYNFPDKRILLGVITYNRHASKEWKNLNGMLVVNIKTENNEKREFRIPLRYRVEQDITTYNQVAIVKNYVCASNTSLIGSIMLRSLSPVKVESIVCAANKKHVTHSIQEMMLSSRTWISIITLIPQTGEIPENLQFTTLEIHLKNGNSLRLPFIIKRYD